MQNIRTIVFSSNINTITFWKNKGFFGDKYVVAENLEHFKECTVFEDKYIALVDYDSVASQFNKLLATNTVPKRTIVLERVPAIQTGKTLIYKGVQAYTNSAILPKHYKIMRETVQNGDVWTYPKLTAALTKQNNTTINGDAKELVESRLTKKEQEVLVYILDGLTNDAIAQELEISLRTVKAHVSAIFEKLHVSDRLSLALLLLR